MKPTTLQERVRQALGGTATQHAADFALQAVIRAIADGLREDGVVKLAKFGTFRLQTQQPRRLLLPGTQQEHILPQRRVVRFTPAPASTAEA